MTLSHRLHGAGRCTAARPVELAGHDVRSCGSAQLPGVAERFRVLTYDHPGHGASRVPESAVHRRVASRRRCSRSSTTCGSSASPCAASRSEGWSRWRSRSRRRSASSVSSSPARPPTSGRPRRGASERAVVRAEGMEAIADAVVARWFTPRFAVERSGDGRALPRDARRDADRGVRALLRGGRGMGRARAHLGDLRPDARHRGEPTTRRRPSEHAELIASSIAARRLVVLERAAHLANVERAEAFTDAVLEHLEQEVFA